jgi:tetratricopeptide (TPR) repeat protein
VALECFTGNAKLYGLGLFAFSFLLLGFTFAVNPAAAWKESEPVKQGLPYRENAITLHQEGQALLKAKRYVEAVKIYQKALGLNPFSALSATLHAGLGQAELALCSRYNAAGYIPQATERYAQAVVSYQYAIALQPDFEDHYTGLIKTWEAGKRLPLAQTQLKTLIKENPADGWAWYLLAQVEKALGNYETEREAMREFVKLQPRSSVKNRWCHYHPEEC